MPEYPNTSKDTSFLGNPNARNPPSSFFSNLIEDIFDYADMFITGISREFGSIHIYAEGRTAYGICPYCGYKSCYVHSRYVRRITSMPVMCEHTVIIFTARKFFCKNPACHYKTFAEQPGNEIFRYRRRTCRCEQAVSREGLSTSCNIASILLCRMGIPISASTVLRDLHRLKVPANTEVRRIGVDDWAQRKGMNYGSIIIDLDTGSPIDLLGGRDMEHFAGWLEKHDNVNLVSRDRSTDYSSAVKSSGRDIVEVADKFHLIKNIMERMSALVSERYADYRNAVRREETTDDTENTGNECILQEKDVHIPPKPDLRKIKFEEVKQLQSKGFKPNTIARKLGIARQTATKFCKLEALPPRKSNARNEYHKFDEYVLKRHSEGIALSTIYKEICLQGFMGSTTPFYDHYRYLSDGHRGIKPKTRKLPEKKRPKDERSSLLPVKSIMATVARSIKGKACREDEGVMETLLGLDWFCEMYKATVSFYKVITGKEAYALIRWMKCFWKTTIPTLKTFIQGLRLDYKAVVNTIRLEVTNGITEGYVNKLKAIKRNMYGRAGIDLLKTKIVLEKRFFN